ncbi:MAG: hypothetical protein ABI716_03675 [Candidatus Saccharibacteria bacterium]
MQKTWLKNYVMAGVAVVAIGVATPLIVNAEPGRTTTVQPTRTPEAQTVPAANTPTEAVKDSQIDQSERQAVIAKRAEETSKRVASKTKLTEAKLTVCRKHEEVIDNIIARMGDRGTKQFDVFTKIADRTEAFYIKSGKVLSDYDALVVDVNTKKAEAQSVLPTMLVTFKCDGTDPQGVASSFKTSRTTLITALRAYKTAVKNLIVGVKSVQDTTVTTDGSKQ